MKTSCDRSFQVFFCSDKSKPNDDSLFQERGGEDESMRPRKGKMEPSVLAWPNKMHRLSCWPLSTQQYRPCKKSNIGKNVKLSLQPYDNYTNLYVLHSNTYKFVQRYFVHHANQYNDMINMLSSLNVHFLLNIQRH
jgi:hypothetical protein